MTTFSSNKAWRTMTGAAAALALAAGCTPHPPTPTSWRDAPLDAWARGPLPGRLVIDYPRDGTLFPPGIAPPTLLWHDDSGVSDAWVVRLEAPGAAPVDAFVTEGSFRPSTDTWARLQSAGPDIRVRVLVMGLRRDDPRKLAAAASVDVSTSRDRVTAPIFFRQVPLPFDFANHHTDRIRYSLGTVEGGQPPRVLLEGLPVCGNCHSFDRAGDTIGMDVDYANDKGSYVIASLEKTTHLTPDKIITWSDYRRSDGQQTFGLLSQISPDGRYAVSTVKDRSIFVGLPEKLEYSQLFFPIRGILAYYDRERREFHGVPGADDPAFVQSNPTWTPDGRTLLFARAPAYHSAKVDASQSTILPSSAASEFLEGQRGFQYDIYRIPFDGGRGGTAEPLAGASANGMSNYFPRVSPNGRWMVFTQSKNFMLLQPDSKLFIVPASGGVPRPMRCNTDRMNSWHSWSPDSHWLVFSSKARGPYTQLWLTHVDDDGNDAPPVLLENLVSTERAANIPEFLAADPQALARIEDDFSDGGNYHYRVAKNLVYYGDLQEAVKRLDRALARAPGDLDALLERGAVLFNLRQRQAAIDDFRAAERLAPQDFRGPYNLGIALAGSNDDAGAIGAFDRAARLNAKNSDIFVQRAVAERSLGRREAALRDSARAAELEPNSAEVRRFLADLEEERGDYAGAITNLDAALRSDADAGTTWLLRSYARLKTDDVEGAEADATRGGALEPRSPLLPLVRGGIALARGDQAAGCATLRASLAQTRAGPGSAETAKVFDERCR